MNQEKFIEVIKEVVTAPESKGLIENLLCPPGRKPSEKLLRMSMFYNSLNAENQAIINEIIFESVDSGIFGFLCVIDGVRSINDSPGDQCILKLSYTDSNNMSEVLLNNTYESYLRDIYNQQ